MVERASRLHTGSSLAMVETTTTLVVFIFLGSNLFYLFLSVEPPVLAEFSTSSYGPLLLLCLRS